MQKAAQIQQGVTHVSAVKAIEQFFKSVELNGNEMTLEHILDREIENFHTEWVTVSLGALRALWEAKENFVERESVPEMDGWVVYHKEGKVYMNSGFSLNYTPSSRARGKIWREKRHAKCAITNAIPRPYYCEREHGGDRQKYIDMVNERLSKILLVNLATGEQEALTIWDLPARVRELENYRRWKS